MASMLLQYRYMRLQGNINKETRSDTDAVPCEESLRIFADSDIEQSRYCNYFDTMITSTFEEIVQFKQNITIIYNKCRKHPGGKIWISYRSKCLNSCVIVYKLLVPLLFMDLWSQIKSYAINFPSPSP